MQRALANATIDTDSGLPREFREKTAGCNVWSSLPKWLFIPIFLGMMPQLTQNEMNEIFSMRRLLPEIPKYACIIKSHT